ncbi:cytochrome P450 [Xylariaceae sp. FL0016]|nr:cytochrome P450 [Xylariaceae sp. FL0016]
MGSVVEIYPFPQMISLSWVIPALFVAYYIITAIVSWYRLRHVPGPILASFSYLWLPLVIFRGKANTELRGLQKYGSIVRIGPHFVVTDDPVVLRSIAGARSKYGKDEWYLGGKLNPHKNSMFSLLDNKSHDSIKAKAASGYSGRDNPDLEAAIDENLCLLIEILRRKHLTTAAQYQVFDFANIPRLFTLDVVTRLAYGKAFGWLECGEGLYGFLTQFDEMVKFLNLACDVPWFRSLYHSRFVYPWLGPKPTDATGVGKVMGVAQVKITERFRQGDASKSDMLSSFINHGMTLAEGHEEAMVQIFAGGETTATSIKGTMLYLMGTPVVYQRLKEEIKQSLERGDISSPITHEQARKLPYLQAVILEGFRMRAPVTYGHFKRVPPGGDTLNGVYLPEGTAIGHNATVLTRREDIFGEDVDVFRPERFLECDKQKRVEMERALDIIFGGGRWMCAGKNIALMELNKIFFEVRALSHQTFSREIRG